MNPLSHHSKSDIKYTLLAAIVIAISLFLLFGHRTPKTSASAMLPTMARSEK